jgi:hypothetical protein
VKAGYKWLLKWNAREDEVVSWKWIWRLTAPEKIKFLYWTVCHDVVPTRSLLHNRGMLDNNNCLRCLTSGESIMHCFRNCPFVKHLWFSLGFDNINFYLENSMVTWLRQGAFSADNHLFSAALWWIWCARNSLCMENEKISLFSLKVKFTIWQPFFVRFSLRLYPRI